MTSGGSTTRFWRPISLLMTFRRPTRREYEHNTRLLKAEVGGDWLARVARRKTDRTPKIGVSIGPTGKK